VAVSLALLQINTDKCTYPLYFRLKLGSYHVERC